MCVVYGFKEFPFGALVDSYNSLAEEFQQHIQHPEVLSKEYLTSCKCLVADLLACQDLHEEENHIKLEMMCDLLGFVHISLEHKSRALDMITRDHNERESV